MLVYGRIWRRLRRYIRGISPEFRDLLLLLHLVYKIPPLQQFRYLHITSSCGSCSLCYCPGNSKYSTKTPTCLPNTQRQCQRYRQQYQTRDPCLESSACTAVVSTPQSSNNNHDRLSVIFNTPSASYGPTRLSSAIRTRTSLMYTVTMHPSDAGYDGSTNNTHLTNGLALMRLATRCEQPWRTMTGLADEENGWA